VAKKCSAEAAAHYFVPKKWSAEAAAGFLWPKSARQGLPSLFLRLKSGRQRLPSISCGKKVCGRVCRAQNFRKKLLGWTFLIFAALNSPAPFDRLGGGLVIVLIVSRCQMTTAQIYNIILRKGI
jgi:hypothetical protein